MRNFTGTVQITDTDTATLIDAESFVGGTDTAINNDPNKNILGGAWRVQ